MLHAIGDHPYDRRRCPNRWAGAVPASGTSVGTILVGRLAVGGHPCWRPLPLAVTIACNYPCRDLGRSRLPL
ncbi:hypothetical protein BHM03_00036158 [Ensete ventricosum]|nr:hypothetical protein BHM03_00036158 [Ensete ventricosum]